MSVRIVRFMMVASAAAVVIALMATAPGKADTPPTGTFTVFIPNVQMRDVETPAMSTASLDGLTPEQYLGKLLYFDAKLSQPDGQACADCHLPEIGFDDPAAQFPVSQGVIPRNRWGNRNSPAAGYAMYAPTFHYDDEEELWFGGQFWDGRATGEELGDPLADQALGPFLNPLEMANPNRNTVWKELKLASYVDLFKEIWGEAALNDVDETYENIARSIAVYERSVEFARFNSRYDHYLQACLELGGDPALCANGTDPMAATARLAILTDQEWYGFQLFVGENDNDGMMEAGEGAFCAACHVTDWIDPADYENDLYIPDWAVGVGMVPPVFTDYSFDNLGAPKNPANPFYTLPRAFNPDGKTWVDLGLGATLQTAGHEPGVYEPEMGKFKVMSLRNIGATAPYLHNGVFTTLADVTHFYVTRDSDPTAWPDPEYPGTVNVTELGNLGLSAEDEAALVAFMLTLTDEGLVNQHVEP